MHHLHKAALAAAMIAVTPVLAPAAAQDRETRTATTRSPAPTLSQSESEAALIDLLGAEKANALLTSTELSRNTVSLDADPAFSSRRARSSGLYGTLRDLKASLADSGSRRSSELSGLIASIDVAENALLRARRR